MVVQPVLVYEADAAALRRATGFVFILERASPSRSGR